MAKARAVWGIDIGQCALKALRCTVGEDGESIVADKYDFIEYPKILSQSPDQQNELIAEALEQFLSRNELKGDMVAMSVSGQAGLSRFFKPPPVDAKTLPDIVRYEVKQQIPFPIDDVIWDWQRMGGTVIDDVTVDAEVGLFAMKREAVFRALQPFTDQKIELDLVQLSPLSSYNVVCHDILEGIPEPEEIDVDNPPESLVVLSIGTDTTDLIVTNGIKLWLRNIPIGGNHFTKQLARELKLTYAKAELLKRNARKAEDPKTVFMAMRPVFTDLVTEIQRSLTFFQSMEKNAKIDRIALFGNAAKLPGLRQFLNRQLDLDIIKISTFKNLKGSGVIDQSSFEDNILSLAPCYGLCIQGLKKARLNTNLLPGEFVTERMIRAKKPWVLASVGSLALAFLLCWFFVSQAWWQVNEDFKEVGTSWKDVAAKIGTTKSRSGRYLDEDKKLNEKLQQINAINDELASSANNKHTWMEMFKIVRESLPRDERIKSDSVDPQLVPFEDRKEIFIDDVETKYFTDVYKWYQVAKPIYGRQFAAFDPETQRKALEAVNQRTQTKRQKTKKISFSERMKQSMAEIEGGGLGSGPTSVVKREEGSVTGPGFVIEIRGHHFHNSPKAAQEQMLGRAYVMKTLLKNLIEKEFDFPGADNPTEGGGKYKITDLGVFYPTMVAYNTQLVPVVINVQPVKKGGDDDKSDDKNQNGKATDDKKSESPDGGEDRNKEVSNVRATTKMEAKRFDFVIQMAWQPRSRSERFAARKERKEKEISARKNAPAKTTKEADSGPKK